jgi:signal transduction histidine kinase
VPANPALLTLLGKAEGDVVGRDLADLVTVTEPGGASSPDLGTDAAERNLPGRPSGAVSYEAVTRAADARSLRLSVTASTIRDIGGRPVRLCLNVVDVTQRWEAARERRAREAAEYARRSAEHARRAAEAASTAKSAFVSALSHELRTPPQAITGFTELLRGLDLTPDQRQAALSHIGGATQHILALVDDVLDLARVEAGALPLDVVEVNAADLVAEVLDLLAPLAATRDVRLGSALRGATGSTTLRVDRKRLRQILINVVGNGMCYNHAGGEVRVDVGQSAADVVEIRVRDTGPGIAADLMERLFVPFDRLDADAGPERGVGLGLVLARTLAEAMSGSLEVSSVAGRGTTVRVTVPALLDPT